MNEHQLIMLQMATQEAAWKATIEEQAAEYRKLLNRAETAEFDVQAGATEIERLTAQLAAAEAERDALVQRVAHYEKQIQHMRNLWDMADGGSVKETPERDWYTVAFDQLLADSFERDQLRAALDRRDGPQ